MSTTEVGRRPAPGKPDSTNRDGVPLQAVIESDRRLDELSCARLLGNVAELVHAAQKTGQPLGTVTPTSIVVLPDGSAKLAAGTASPGYAAPEQLRGAAGDRRTDVFALGVVLWEVLAHERLFNGSDDDAIKRAVLERAIRPPSELNANVPAELDAICKRALARDPADRYQSARVMAAEIDAVLGDAGYPESNEPIATYLARAFAAPEPAGERAPAAAPTSRSAGTLPPPPLKPPARVAAGAATSPESGPIAAPKPASPAAAPGATSPPPFAPATTLLGSTPSATKPPTTSAPATVLGPSPTRPPFAPVAAENPSPGSTPGSATKPPPFAPWSPTSTVPGNAPGPATKPPPFAPVVPENPVPRNARPSTTKPPAFSPSPTSTVLGNAPGSATKPPSFAPVVPESTVPGNAPPSATRPPPFSPAFPTSAAPGNAPGATTPPPFAPVVPASAPGSGPIASPAAPGTLPSFSAQPRPPAQTVIVGSPGAEPSTLPPAVTAPFGSQAVSATIIEPAFKPVALPASAPAKFAKTEVLGSAAPPPVSASAGDPQPTPASAAGPHPVPTSAAGPHPALPFARMEAPPMLAQIAVETKLPDPNRPAHPQPPKSIATAETLATPQLPTHLAAPAAMPPSTSPPAMPPPLAKPPIAKPPSSRPVQSAADDADAFGAEHHADPAEVIALHQADANAASGVREGRDVLAGWGWSTGSVQALDDDEAEDALRRSRRNLVIAIGGALGVVIIIAIVAFAFSGSKKPDERDRHGAIAQPSPTAAISATAPETPTAPPAQPTDPTAAANANSVKAEPPTAQPAPGEPPGPGAVVPPQFDSAKPEPQVDPSKAEPAKAEPPKPEPPKVAVAPKPMAPKAEPPKPEPAKVIDAKKPSETKKPPDKAAKRPPPPEKIAKASPRAQPVDPYAIPETRKADPATAYRTGLQQYAHGDTAGALATFRGSLATNPGFAPTWRGIGLVYEKMGNKGQARAAFKRYLQLAPTAGDADQIRDRMERLGS